jgi:hypothetical protein
MEQTSRGKAPALAGAFLLLLVTHALPVLLPGAFYATYSLLKLLQQQ